MEKASVAKKAEVAVRTVKTVKKENRLKENRVVRYFKEVRAELSKVVWPSRRNALNLTAIVLAVTASMSILMGLLDWLFAKLFALLLG